MMILDKDITKWPDAPFTKWAALVDKTAALNWNRKVVDPAKISACSAKISASSPPIRQKHKPNYYYLVNTALPFSNL
jgi:hypothetical protein